LDAYLEELYDLITFCIQNPNSSDFEVKRQRVEEIGYMQMEEELMLQKI
jgi:hypothetical protein